MSSEELAVKKVRQDTRKRSRSVECAEPNCYVRISKSTHHRRIKKGEVFIACGTCRSRIRDRSTSSFPAGMLNEYDEEGEDDEDSSSSEEEEEDYVLDQHRQSSDLDDVDSENGDALPNDRLLDIEADSDAAYYYSDDVVDDEDAAAVQGF